MLVYSVRGENPRQVQDDGKGVFRRSAAQAAASARPWRRKSARTGPAVWGECSVCLEDFQPTSAQRSDGRVEQRHGPRSRIGPEVQARLRDLLRHQPDLTLAELQERLEESAGVAVSVQHLWRVLQKMGLRLKKSHSTHRSKTQSKSKPAARAGGKR